MSSGNAWLVVVVARPGARAEVRAIETSTRALHDLVDGYLEAVPASAVLDGWPHPDVDFYVNDDGKGLRLEANLRIRGDVIVGPIVAFRSDGEGNEIPLEAEQARRVAQTLDRLRGFTPEVSP